MIKVGPHISISKGYTNALKDAEKIGATTFQFFSRNPRGGNIKKINCDDIETFNNGIKNSRVSDILCHAPYTYNLASKKESVREFAERSIIDDLERINHINCKLYNIHPGSHTGLGVEKGIELISDSLNRILKTNINSIILLESMSGKGTEIGSSFQELRKIIDNINSKENVGVCLDTCHIFSAGYDIVENLNGVLLEFDKIIGLKYLKAIHLNDSKMPFDKNKDRHAPLGEGYLGIETFENIINNEKIKNLPFFLETPNDLKGYKKEIKMLKELKKDE
ncbi:MAG: deoxyribonuclease IV [Bacillota bacterium]|nr:deoxyribonuclease IV [Bacillota bacterium]